MNFMIASPLPTLPILYLVLDKYSDVVMLSCCGQTQTYVRKISMMVVKAAIKIWRSVTNWVYLYYFFFCKTIFQELANVSSYFTTVIELPFINFFNELTDKSEYVSYLLPKKTINRKKARNELGTIRNKNHFSQFVNRKALKVKSDVCVHQFVYVTLSMQTNWNFYF